MTREARSADVSTPCGKVHITLNVDDAGAPCLILADAAKQGSCLTAMLRAITSLMNDGLGSGLDLARMLLRIRGHHCTRVIFQPESKQHENCLTSVARKIADLARLELPEESVEKGLDSAA